MILQARSLVKTFQLGQTLVRALDGVDLDVEEGQMVALIGPSGSGKSTLMHILGCLDRPDSGSYVLGGENVAQLDSDRLAEIRNQKIGFVFQTFNLLPRVSAVENVELPLLYGGHRDVRERAEEALRIVGLAERMDHEPNQLSGGQRQRVAIARAIVTNPAILLADEPTGNLDSKTSEEILQLFLELNAQGRTLLVVTHDTEVAELCQRQLRFKDGRIVEDIINPQFGRLPAQRT